VEASRRQVALLGGILVVLAGVIYWQLTRGDAAPAGPAPAAAARGGAQPGSAAPSQRPAAASRIPAVAIAALDRSQPEPADIGRDPFRFGEGTAEGPESPRRGPFGHPMSGQQPGVSGPEAPPVMPEGPPPIQLKFIGTARQGSGRLYAVLRDERGIYYGADGDVVEGRYRVLRVSASTVEVSYVDGRGRVNIPLSGGQP
jgi:hypothetical protein